MNNLIVERLYIFSPSEKKAKLISFSKGINVITSNKIDGNKKGKSVILKSIYHTLGADCFFEDKWDKDNKVYILDVSVRGTKFYFYRIERLFKIFNYNKQLIFSTIDRTELAEFLSTMYDFKIALPSRNKNKLALAPPAFSYILNFIDQDKMDGTKFASFENLGQFPNFKENTLFGHFGVFNEKYYRLMIIIDELNDKKNKVSDDLLIINKMLEKVRKDLGNGYPNITSTLSTLKIELEKTKKEYETIINNLNKSTKSLIKLRNQKYEIEQNLIELQKSRSITKLEIKDLNNHICPICKSQIKDTLKHRLKRHNDIEDFIFLNSELVKLIKKIERKTEKEELNYKSTLVKLKDYEQNINAGSSEINDALKYKGYQEVKESLLNDWDRTHLKLEKIEKELKQAKKEKNIYNNQKKVINKAYYKLMLEDKIKFRLKEINKESFTSVKNNFNAGGSNKPIATIIWYFNLLRLKYKFNELAIKFPLILDSPNNVELDEVNRHELFEYLFSNIDTNTQLIISTLGFNKIDYPKYKIDNIVELTNKKYELLSEEDFQKHKQLLYIMSDIK